MKARIASSSTGDYSAARTTLSAMTVPSSPRAVTLLLLLAFVLRVVALVLLPIEGALFSDMDNYRDIADGILAGDWKATHFLPAIGFSLILAAFKRLFTNWAGALAVYHVLLSTATVWLVWKSATRAF